MFGSFMPKEGKFFDHFVELAEHILQACAVIHIDPRVRVNPHADVRHTGQRDRVE